MPKITINTPQNFSFQSTIYSHGWSDLLPFKIDPDNKILHYAFISTSGIPYTVLISYDVQNKIIIETDNKSNHIEWLFAKTIRIFRLEEDFEEFYKIAEYENDFKWVVEKGAGRMLRTASIWEDMVKMLCTTNCTWRLTQIMTENLFTIVGDSKFFPNAETIAQKNEQFLRDEIKMGYRAPYLLDFAQKVATGKLDLNKFENWQGDSISLYKEMKKIKGFGDYAVSSLMKLLGRYDFMGFDSWNRKQFYNKHNNGKPCSDERITKYYKKYEKWAGLFFWLDVTKDWYFKTNPWD